jgi:RHS repeat-associated protein
MAKTSGTADEILNLPKGGGSVGGTGSAFDVDLNTGTASVGFSLPMPTGPNGIKPTITLRYHSGTGDGAFGMGWTLAFLTIARKRDPAPKRLRQEAVGDYTLLGVGDLMRMADGRYRPTVDTTRQVIRRSGDGWTITDLTDTVHTLGATTNARIAPAGQDAAAWLLERTADSLGNRIDYAWQEDGSARLPGRVTWGTYRLEFLYEARPDRISDGSYGTAVMTSLRCRRIELHVTTENASLVRSWSISYDDAVGTGRSLLARIAERGHAADGSTQDVPPRSFSYSKSAAPTIEPVRGFLAPLSSPDTDLVDMDGDALPELLVLGAGRPAVHPNLGHLRFGAPRPLSRLPAPARLSSRGVAFADMDGDGSADLMVLNRPLAGYYPLAAPRGGTGPSRFSAPVRFAHAPHVWPADPSVRLLDLNRDAVTDVLVDTGRNWLEWLRDSTGFARTPRILSAERRPPSSLKDPRTYMADMTGDGLTDVVRVDGGGVTYWPGRADGGWDKPVRMTPSLALPRDHDPRRITLIDVDGDGCADLVHVGSESVTVWRNMGADRLSAPQVISNTPPAKPGTFRFVDLAGSGMPGILFDLPASRPGGVRQVFLDLMGGSKPYLLVGMDNGIGLSTRITYRSSTEYALDDNALGTPWRTYHPFPIQCVARVDDTAVGSGVTRSTIYRYHEARFDPVARSFLGFGRVASDQLGDDTMPTMRTETLFHLGLDPDDPSRPLTKEEALRFGALRRRVLSTTVWGLDGSAAAQKPYSVVRQSYGVNLIPSGTGDGAVVAVPFLARTTEERQERTDAPISTRITEFLEVSADGDVTLQRTRAQRPGNAASDQDMSTRTVFASGGTNICLPARITQTAADGSIVSCTITYYDGPDFVGLPERQATHGLVTRIEDLALTDDMVHALWGASPPDLTKFGYHRLPGDATGWWITRRSHARTSSAQGPVLVTRCANGAETRSQLDAAGQRVVSITDALGNGLRASIDPRSAQTQAMTDASGNVTRDAFDALGRVAATFAPGDPPDKPGLTFAYTTGAISRVDARQRVAVGGEEMTRRLTWLDASGNKIGRAKPSAQAGAFIAYDVTRYNTRGQPVSTFVPYVVDGDTWQDPPAGTAATTTRYDALGRMIAQSDPRGFTVRLHRDGATVTVTEQRGAGGESEAERHVFDAAGQLVSVARNAGGHWVEQAYSYQAHGAIEKVTLPGGIVIAFGHDLLGRRISHESADTGRTVYLLDAMGNERERWLATGQKVRTDVDLLGRVTTVSHDDEIAPRVRYEYLEVSSPAPADGTANRIGRLYRVSDEVGTTVLSYDPRGQITSKLVTPRGGGTTYALEASYDALGRVTSVVLPAILPGGPRRRIDNVFGPDELPISASGIVNNATYDIFGRPLQIAYANGTTTEFTYEANGGPLSRVRVLDGNGQTLRDATATRANGLMAAIASAMPGDDPVQFAYDPLKRLVAASYGGAEAHGWTFDDLCRLTATTETGALDYAQGTHRLASVGGTTWSWDAAGRLASGHYGTLVYDSEDRLTRLTRADGVVLTNTYDHRGRRAASARDARQFYLSPLDDLEIRDGTPVLWLRFGRLRVAAEVGGSLWFLHPNLLGAQDLITAADGTFAHRLRQTPFGAGRPGGVAPAGAAAVLAKLLSGDDPSGLVCLGFRWYDPRLGQFISPDPIISGAYLIGAWNPYVYCLGNPVALSDPSGAGFWDVVGMIALAVLVAAIVVAAVFTCGAALVALGVVAAETVAGVMTTSVMVGTAIGAFGGALSGELAAQKAGGNILAGALLGGLLGGVAAFTGGALGMVIGHALGETSFWAFVVTGTTQGILTGAATGLATGYAGGAGSGENIWKSVLQNAAWGGALGFVLSAGTWATLYAAGGSQYLQVLTVQNKYDAAKAYSESGIGGFLNTTDNQAGLGNDIGVAIAHGGPTGGDIGGGIFDFITPAPGSVTQADFFWDQGAVFNIPLGWIPTATFQYGFFSQLVSASMIADQAGFSYADQVGMIIKGAPYFIDYAYTLFTEADPGESDKVNKAFNEAFGSATTKP